MAATHAPILAVIDPTASTQPALQRAADLARRLNAPLILLACVFDPYIAGGQLYAGIDLRKLRRTALDQQLGALRRLGEPLHSQGLTVSCRAVFDHPLHEGIVREVLKLQPALVVKDTHHHTALARAFFSNTDWQLIRECAVPLWLVRPVAPGAGPDHPTVLAAVDPLHEHDKPASLDRLIIGQAQMLSVLYEERLHVIHAFNPALPGPGAALPMAAALPVALQPEILAQIRRDHESALDQLAADVGLPANQVHLVEADPAEALPRLARELRAGIVVMGAVARGRLRRAFVGSTAERVLEHLPCDVVVVKPAGFESPVTSRGKAAGYLVRNVAL